MPLLFHEPLRPHGEWGVWSITESEADLRKRVLLYPREAAQLAAIRGGGRRREFLAARWLLHDMSGRPERGELLKDEFGKPHLTDSPFHVSLSHTHGFSAAIAHPQPCGVDIQTYVARIGRLAHKFVGPTEDTQLLPGRELTQLHLLWSAKEALYKAYGRRQLDFRQHLRVDFGTYDPDGGTARGWIEKGDFREVYALTYRITADYVLVGAVREAN